MRRKVPAFLLLLVVLLACHISEEERGEVLASRPSNAQ
jgi:hypothetical protein